MSPRKVAVILVDRANYGRLKPVMAEISNRPKLQMDVICAGTMLLERFGNAVQQVRNDGFNVAGEIHIELEGSTPITMTKSLGFAVIEFASEFQRLKPDIVLIIGDRYEALAAALAASYMNMCVAHIQGGEISGSIDESARHCITKLAHYHFPATAKAKDVIIRMGERPETVFQVGCPSVDLACKLDRNLPAHIFRGRGVGANVDPNKPFLLVVFHPVTTHYTTARDETRVLLETLDQLQMPTVWLWPNIDAGADLVSKSIRVFREHQQPEWLHLEKNFSPEEYIQVLAGAACAVGNSSSFVRDSAYLGTPVVLLGNRQEGREFDQNVLPVAHIDPESILSAIQQQLATGRYPTSKLYGQGDASAQIADKLCAVELYQQKQMIIHVPDPVTANR